MRFLPDPVLRSLPGLMVGGLLAACAGDSLSGALPTSVESIPSPTPIPVLQQPTVAPTLQPTPSGPLKLVVWWPEPLAPVGNQNAEALLAAQIEAFENSAGDVRIERRLKKVADAGGILSTLRSASIAAPGALPDVTLLRREDLLTIVQAGLIQPFGEQAVESRDLPANLLGLGQVNQRLFGVPYMLEIQYMAYRADRPIESWRFEDVLARRLSFAFPGHGSPVAISFYVQYLAAGGAPPQAGALTPNADALRTVLAFYEAASSKGLIDKAVADYSASTDYAAALAGGQLDMGVVSSTLYLQLRAEGDDLLAGPLPTDSGQLVTALNGWMWVIVTSNADRRTMALRFIDWMMDVDRQGQYAQAISMLPSQRAAFRSLDSADLDVDLIDSLLANAIIPLGPNDGGAAARAMQNALLAVLAGTRTADEAAQDVIDEANG